MDAQEWNRAYVNAFREIVALIESMKDKGGENIIAELQTIAHNLELSLTYADGTDAANKCITLLICVNCGSLALDYIPQGVDVSTFHSSLKPPKASLTCAGCGSKRFQPYSSKLHG